MAIPALFFGDGCSFYSGVPSLLHYLLPSRALTSWRISSLRGDKVVGK